MEIETSTLMMVFFIILLVVSIWKIYAFLPNKVLKDDDTTKESKDELISLIIEEIKNYDGDITNKKLFEMVKKNKKFDSKHYWRFNQNRLNQLLQIIYLKYDVESIKEIKLLKCIIPIKKREANE